MVFPQCIGPGQLQECGKRHQSRHSLSGALFPKPANGRNQRTEESVPAGESAGRMETARKHRTSTGQAQDKYGTSVEGSPKDHRRIVEESPSKHRTSTGQVQDMLHADNPNIQNLICVVGEKELSVKEMMSGIGLKGRDNFLNLYLNPAISEGYVRLLYPQSPRHPRQKYLLTVKGVALYNELTKGE